MQLKENSVQMQPNRKSNLKHSLYKNGRGNWWYLISRCLFLPISRGPAIGFGRKKRSAFEDDNTKDEEDLLAVFDSQKKNRLIFS